MFVQEFPNLAWLRQQIDSRFANRKGWNDIPLDDQGWPTVVMNACANQEDRRQLLGPLSIFTNVKGTSIIGTEQGETTVSNSSYAITNHDELYDLTIDTVERVETSNIHFGFRFYQEALHLLTSVPSKLLDDPFYIHSQPKVFTTGSIFRTAQFDQLLKAAMKEQETEDNEEIALFNLFVEIHKDAGHDFGLLRVRKMSTAKELMKRLQRAVDYLHNNFSHTIDMNELCMVSCLSKFHLIRTFKQYFGYSPYQYLKKLRLQKATDLVTNTNLDLQDIALSVGFQNASSLSRMIKQATGHSPRQLIK